MGNMLPRKRHGQISEERGLERNKGWCFGKMENSKINFAYAPHCVRPAKSSQWTGIEIEVGTEEVLESSACPRVWGP